MKGNPFANWTMADLEAHNRRVRKEYGTDIGRLPPSPEPVTPDALWTKYLELGSIHKASVIFGFTGETGRQILRKAGKRLNRSAWTPEEAASVERFYKSEAVPVLSKLAAMLNRTHAAIACKAHELGLTFRRGKNPKHRQPRPPKLPSAELRARISARAKEWHKNNPHPRGMLNKKHTDEVKRKMSLAHAGQSVSPERVRQMLQTKLARYGTLSPNTKRGSWKAGWRDVGGKRFYARSRWEANYARYLEVLKLAGEIMEWEHEPETFWFLKIMRGTRCYTPDFRVTLRDGSQEYHEVKGWMDSTSLTKLNRMRIYHPCVKMVVRDARWYKGNRRQLQSVVPGWEI